MARTWGLSKAWIYNSYFMRKEQQGELRREYIAPSIELWQQATGYSILEIVSLEGEIQDFVDGEDF